MGKSQSNFQFGRMERLRQITVVTSTGHQVEVYTEDIHKITRRSNDDQSGYLTIRITDQQAAEIMEQLWDD